MKRTYAFLLLAAELFGLYGCAPTQNVSAPECPFKTARHDDPSAYVVDPPDDIELVCPKTPDLHGQRATVGNDGIVRLKYLGELQVKGKGVGEIQREVNAMAKRNYPDAHIQVQVYADSKFYMIFGRELPISGKKACTGNDNVVKAISTNLKSPLWPEQVRLVRPAREGHEAAVAIIDLKRINETGDLKQNYVIEAGDILYLPPSCFETVHFKLTPVLGGNNGVSEPRPASAAEITLPVQTRR